MIELSLFLCIFFHWTLFYFQNSYSRISSPLLNPDIWFIIWIYSRCLLSIINNYKFYSLSRYRNEILKNRNLNFDFIWYQKNSMISLNFYHNFRCSRSDLGSLVDSFAFQIAEGESLERKYFVRRYLRT